ncbi:MAG: hypothetical protein ACREJ6_06300 [Candidatus Methylomirabilis sp.]
MGKIDPEKLVEACYSTWSQTYYDEFYGPKATYPPVHVDLLKRIFREARVKSVLDAGCGPASMLHDRIVSSGVPVENHMMFLWQLINLEAWLSSLNRGD